MNQHRPMSIGTLFRREDQDFARAFAIALRDRGHGVLAARSGEELLVGAPFDLVIVDAQLPGQWSGLGLLEALDVSGEVPLAILVGEELGSIAFRQALRFGVRDLVPRPLDACALMESVEKALEDALLTRRSLVRSLAPVGDCAGTGARAVGAFLLEQGVAPSHRVRIATALAEVLHLASRPGGGAAAERIALRARAHGETVAVEVETQGANLAALSVVGPALPGFPDLGDELARARRLCEEITVHPTPAGTRVVLSFTLTPLRFEEESNTLAEQDYLHPETVQKWLSELAHGDAETRIPPSMTTTIGRLLEGLPVDDKAFLWK